MPQSKIEPHRITKPVQLLAVLLTALTVLVASFLYAAKVTTYPPWLSATFGITAVAIVPFFVLLIFLMLTRFRTHIQEDPYYAK